MMILGSVWKLCFGSIYRISIAKIKEKGYMDISLIGVLA